MESGNQHGTVPTYRLTQMKNAYSRRAIRRICGEISAALYSFLFELA